MRSRRADLAGQSLLPAERVEAPDGSYFEALSAAFNRGWAPLRGILAKGDKYIDLPIQELYDLPTDPAEEKNLAAAGARSRCAGCASSCSSCRRRRRSAGTIGSEEAAKLKSLGYLTGSAELKAAYGPADDPKTLIEVDQTIHIIMGLLQEDKFDQALVDRAGRSSRKIRT